MQSGFDTLRVKFTETEIKRQLQRDVAVRPTMSILYTFIKAPRGIKRVWTV